MDDRINSDDLLRDILTGSRTIAVVGASPRPQRPSHGVMRFLQRHGYRTIPVNPFAAGDTIRGARPQGGDDPLPGDRDPAPRTGATLTVHGAARSFGGTRRLLLAHARLLGSIVAGAAIAFALPADLSPTFRAVVGWDCGIAVF